jgi:hypothetical protein
MDFLLVLRRHPSSIWKILGKAELGTNMMKDCLTLAYTFTGGTKVE